MNVKPNMEFYQSFWPSLDVVASLMDYNQELDVRDSAKSSQL